MSGKGSVNKVILLGNLGQDAELRYLPNGQAMAQLSVATTEAWKDGMGQKQERTEWHRVCLWGKLAEIAGEYLRKGSKVYLEGRLQTRKWQDKQGQDRYTTEIVADTMTMVGGGPAQGAGSGPAPSAPSAPAAGGGGNANEWVDDDIPF